MSLFPEITTEELEELLQKGEKVNLIDVREDFEVARGMIPGAKHIPMGEIPLRMEELDPETEYIFICKGGVRSANVCHFLLGHGYKVKNMVGGMLEWDGKVE